MPVKVVLTCILKKTNLWRGYVISNKIQASNCFFAAKFAAKCNTDHIKNGKRT